MLLCESSDINDWSCAPFAHGLFLPKINSQSDWPKSWLHQFRSPWCKKNHGQTAYSTMSLPWMMVKSVIEHITALLLLAAFNKLMDITLFSTWTYHWMIKIVQKQDNFDSNRGSSWIFYLGIARWDIPMLYFILFSHYATIPRACFSVPGPALPGL